MKKKGSLSNYPVRPKPERHNQINTSRGATSIGLEISGGQSLIAKARAASKSRYVKDQRHRVSSEEVQWTSALNTKLELAQQLAGVGQKCDTDEEHSEVEQENQKEENSFSEDGDQIDDIDEFSRDSGAPNEPEHMEVDDGISGEDEVEDTEYEEELRNQR